MSLIRSISVLMMMFALSQAVDAQIRIISKERLDSVANPPLASDAAYMEFERTRIDAGTIPEDEGIRRYRYEFRNVGKNPLSISRVVTTCSCLSAVCSPLEIMPGQTGSVTVSYNPVGHPGRFERRVFVYTAGNTSPTAVLWLLGHVENASSGTDTFPVQMGKIRMECSGISFREGESSRKIVRFRNFSGKAMRLECESMLLPGCIELKINPEVVEDGAVGEILIIYDASVPIPPSGRAGIIFKELGVPPSQSSLAVDFRK